MVVLGDSRDGLGKLSSSFPFDVADSSVCALMKEQASWAAAPDARLELPKYWGDIQQDGESCACQNSSQREWVLPEGMV